jgi:hypothetical protein
VSQIRPTPAALEDARADYYRALFALVCDPADWKAPVDCVVPFAIGGDVQEAVVFMTGALAARETIAGGKEVRVWSVGYRAGPCGP